MSKIYPMLLDRLIISGLVFLVLFTPLAFGSVHPWAYSLMEAVIFSLVIVWALRLLTLARRPADACGRWPTPLMIPLFLLIGFVLFQLVPLPPPVLRVISPSTYEVYTRSLYGWPGRSPYEDAFAPTAAAWSPTIDNETGEHEDGGNGAGTEIRQSALGNRVSEPDVRAPHDGGLWPMAENWMPLSLAPALTKIDLLKLVSYTSLFFLILCYPFAPGGRPSPETRHRTPDTGHPSSATEHLTASIKLRKLLYSMMFMGFVVALLGFVNLFTWNGKVLWFFVPYDGATSGTRAASPFISPDNFANYLAMVFPLTLTGLACRSFLIPQKHEGPFRILCGFAAFIMLCSLVLSLSRGGWGAAILAVTVLFVIMSDLRGGRKKPESRHRTPSLSRLTLVGVLLALVLSIVFIGPESRRQLDFRLLRTVNQGEDLAGRLPILRDGREMVRDFPLLGIGLGSWPEVFPRYQSPRLASFYREAHNDYFEFLAETGLVGFLLFGWFFWVCLGRIFHDMNRLDPATVPVVAALLAGMSAMAFHEFFDFSLQVPANALLFTVLLAVAVRLSLRARQGDKGRWGQGSAHHPVEHSEIQNSKYAFGLGSSVLGRQRAAALFLGLGAVLLLYAALGYDPVPYPHSLASSPPATVAQAVERIRSFPARAEAHIHLFRLLSTGLGAVDDPGSQGSVLRLASRVHALRTALWLEPKNTRARDVYAALLISQGDVDEGLRQVTRSVMDLPSLSDHFYLKRKWINLLGPLERKAIEKGFKDAVSAQRPGAVDQLGAFYAVAGRFLERAALYEEAAANSDDPNDIMENTFEAADSRLKAGDLKNAEALFLTAAAMAPADTRPYTGLIRRVYGPQKKIDRAEATVADAMAQGAPPFTLYLSLVEAARTAGDLQAAKKALDSAFENISAPGNGRNSFKEYLTVAQAAQRVGDRKTQRLALGKAAEVADRGSRAQFLLGILYYQMGDADRAALHFRKAAQADPKSADAFYHLGVAEERRFQFVEAQKAYESAFKLAPDNPGIRTRYEAFKERILANK